MQVVANLLATLHIDNDILDYLSAYFDDPSNDFQTDTLTQFLGPFLEAFGANSQRIQRLCQQLSKHYYNPDALIHDHKPAILDAPVHMKANEAKIMDFDRPAVGDISHTMNRNVQKSTVDQTKLREAEARLKKKREKRGMNDLWSPIPVWNPDIVPPIIINQAKQATSESRSKDIKIENFDISYGGKTILTDATLSLAYGRHYGLVGKNGVGKSTLLRAIASGELAISKHIRILHVEQEITGDDTQALVAVMQADSERENLLAEEKVLNKTVNTASSTPDEVGHASQRLREVYSRLQEIDSDSAESRYLFIFNRIEHLLFWLV
jgi:ATP-binding cassette subfamily F protein 3